MSRENEDESSTSPPAQAVTETPPPARIPRDFQRTGFVRPPDKFSAAVFVLFFAAVMLLQFRSGAYMCMVGGDSDEPSHYVTGLMVRDYIASGMTAPPMEYAENYYLHYPKVGLGQWPPFFYVIQAAWTLLFSPSRLSVMLLMAVIGALLVTTTCSVIRREFSAAFGVAAGLFMLSLPLIQHQTEAIMADLLVALLVFLAALSFGRYLDSERWQDSVWFGIWASLALLTKGSAIVLAIIPPLSLLLSRRWRLALRWSFWLSALVVLVVCSPWYLLVPGARHETVTPYGGLGFKEPRLLLAPLHLYAQGIVPLLLAAHGLFEAVRWRLGPGNGRWVAALSLLLGLIFLPAVMSVAAEERYLISGVSVLLMFMAISLAWLTARLSGRLKSAVAILPAVACFAYSVHQVVPGVCRGYGELAQVLLSKPELRDSVMLVSSDPVGEGVLVAEVAVRENRPGHIVLRASKLLASVSWMGGSYQLLFHTPAEVMQQLERIPISILVMDRSPTNQFSHNRLLWEVLRAYPGRWERIGFAGPNEGSGKMLEAYRLRGSEGRPRATIRLDLRRSLGRYIER